MAIHDHHSMGLESHSIRGPLGPFEYVKVAFEQGGKWETFLIHSLEMPNGARWDALNGWNREAYQGYDPAGLAMP